MIFGPSGAGGGGLSGWVTGTVYAKDDVIYYSNYIYQCIVAHTAGASFEADIIAGKWVYVNKMTYSENLATVGFNFEDNDVGGWTATGCATVTNGLPVSVGSGAAAFSSSNGGRAKGANTSNPAIVSSGQINGLYSLSLATTGAGTIGDGYVSSAYPIPIKYQAKVLTLEFAYKVVTGSPVMGGTSSDTYAVAVYDVANNAWLGVTNPFCFNTTSAVGIARTQFQTAYNTTSLQIFVYSPVAPTGASALYLDDFSIRPQEISYGSVQLDTIAYTPTWTGLGTPAVNTAYYRKEGDCLYVSGTVTGGTHSASVVSLTLPSGLTMDSSKIATATTVGDMNATNTPFSGAMYKGSSNTLIYLVSGSATPASASPGTTWANGTQFGFNFKVPILGWSSSVQMSSDASTRVLSVYYTGSPPTGTLSAAYNDVTFPTKVSDTHNIYSGATATISVTGFYNINASLGITATASAVNASARLICAIYVNTTQIVKNDAFTVTTASSSIEATATLNGIFLTAGSTVKIQSYVDSALTSPAWSSDPARNYLNITQCQGPSQIAATERIAAIITGDPASASSGNPIIVPTVIYDSHGAYNATTGRYTCPAPGLYKMYGAMQSASSATSLTLYKNAASTILAGNLDSNGEATFAGSMYCLAGDIIDIRPGGTVDATSFSLNIERS